MARIIYGLLLAALLALGGCAHETPEQAAQRSAAIDVKCKAWAYKKIPPTAPEAEARVVDSQITRDREELYRGCLVKYGITPPEPPKAPSP